MRITFFQNCISPHQMPYIEAMSGFPDVQQVTVVAPCVTLQERASLGWSQKGYSATKGSRECDEDVSRQESSVTKLQVCIAPSLQEVREILAHTDVALFSGITAFPDVTAWLRLSMDYPVRRGSITEAPLTISVDGRRRKPLWLHRLRFLLKDYRLARRFDWVFAIGPDAVTYYRSWQKWGLNWKVVPFLYCTRITDAIEEECSHSNTTIEEDCTHSNNTEEDDCTPANNTIEERELKGPMHLLYVGALTQRKDVMTLLRSLVNVSFDYQLTIVGDGPERQELEHFAQDHRLMATFIGSLQMDDCQKIMAENDLLVLPSRHDGWGAVVNEAMAVGTQVICSDHCGARQLLTESGMGRIFRSGDDRQLQDCLRAAADDLSAIRSQRVQLRQWAKENISPSAVAQRMIGNL